MCVFLCHYHYCFDYNNFVILFEIRKCDVSIFVLSQGCFGYQGLLWFLMNFRIVYSISVNFLLKQGFGTSPLDSQVLTEVCLWMVVKIDVSVEV